MGAGEVWSNGDMKSKGKNGSGNLRGQGALWSGREEQRECLKKNDGKMWRQQKEGVR